MDSTGFRLGFFEDCYKDSEGIEGFLERIHVRILLGFLQGSHKDSKGS